MDQKKSATSTPTTVTTEPSEEGKISSPGASITQDGTARLSLQRTVSGPPYTIFTPRAKMFIVIAVSISSLISPSGATTFYPALDTIAADYHVTPTLINLSLTTYMIAQAIAPALIAGMSDHNGRRLSYMLCFVIFLLADIGLALQRNYAALLVLRMVQAFGCSAAIALSNAVVADIATSAERGRYMGYATAGLLFGPAFGPTIGGLFAQFLGWRSTFWFLAIFAGCLLIVFGLLFPETCRNVVGNGSIPAKGVNRSLLGYLQQRKHGQMDGGGGGGGGTLPPTRRNGSGFPNPLNTLRILADRVSGPILLYNGFFFTGMMVVTASIPTMYQEIYGLSELDIGLCYISMGIGSLVSTLTMGHVADWNFRRHARRLGLDIKKGRQQDLSDFPIERARYEAVLPGHIIGTLAFIVYGWTLQFHTHLAGPEVALFFIGFGVSTAFNITNTLLIDLHKDKPATATAAVNFVRCLMSAGGAAAIIPMIRAMGAGWAFTLIASLYVVLIGAVVWFMIKGQGLRKIQEEQRRTREEEMKREKGRDQDLEGGKSPVDDSQSVSVEKAESIKE
ncbi:transporter AQR1 [Lecanosticta acicola]|uniref:Transporter AQR1 n=1 Tax=Lecanosticta acicola TaxID=111012 RepID=A0AAI8Z6S5_9PEZI|nr:transporter AQR1 [Lecanosticta acicola]